MGRVGSAIDRVGRLFTLRDIFDLAQRYSSVLVTALLATLGLLASVRDWWLDWPPVLLYPSILLILFLTGSLALRFWEWLSRLWAPRFPRKLKLPEWVRFEEGDAPAPGGRLLIVRDFHITSDEKRRVNFRAYLGIRMEAEQKTVKIPHWWTVQDEWASIVHSHTSRRLHDETISVEPDAAVDGSLVFWINPFIANLYSIEKAPNRYRHVALSVILIETKHLTEKEIPTRSITLDSF